MPVQQLDATVLESLRNRSAWELMCPERTRHRTYDPATGRIYCDDRLASSCSSRAPSLRARLDTPTTSTIFGSGADRRARVFIGVFPLSPQDSLYHDSGTEDIAMLDRSDNRLSPRLNVPLYWAKKHLTGNSAKGVMYEFRIRPAVWKRYGGIPYVVAVCGSVFEGISILSSRLLKPSRRRAVSSDGSMGGTLPGSIFSHAAIDRVLREAVTLPRDDGTSGGGRARPAFNGVWLPNWEYQIVLGANMGRFLEKWSETEITSSDTVESVRAKLQHGRRRVREKQQQERQHRRDVQARRDLSEY